MSVPKFELRANDELRAELNDALQKNTAVQRGTTKTTARC